MEYKEFRKKNKNMDFESDGYHFEYERAINKKKLFIIIGSSILGLFIIFTVAVCIFAKEPSKASRVVQNDFETIEENIDNYYPLK